MDLIKVMNLDFGSMSDEDLDELITKAQEAKERRKMARKKDLWNKIRQSVENYIMEYGLIEFNTENFNGTFDADCLNKVGQIILLD